MTNGKLRVLPADIDEAIFYQICIFWHLFGQGFVAS